MVIRGSALKSLQHACEDKELHSGDALRKTEESFGMVIEQFCAIFYDIGFRLAGNNVLQVTCEGLRHAQGYNGQSTYNFRVQNWLSGQ